MRDTIGGDALVVSRFEYVVVAGLVQEAFPQFIDVGLKFLRD